MQKNYAIILFDLDGTLTDPKEGITRSVAYALQQYGIITENLDMLEAFIGPPLAESFSAYYGFDPTKAKQAVDYYREYFAEKGIFENKLYPNVPSLLRQLKDNGKKIALATSKPTVYAERIVEYFGIQQHFDHIVGSHLDGTRTAKTEIIEHSIRQFPLFRREFFIMVGDREHDLIGANNAGIDSVAVTYGYGSLQELQKHQPTYTVHSVEELAACFTL